MNPKVNIILEDGRSIKVTLYPEYAPLSVENFLKHVDNKMFDGVIFHRVIANFMIQTGAYYINKDYALDQKEALSTVKGEFLSNGVNNTLIHELGVISMARTSDKNSGSNQFFLCSTTCPHLDGEYAAFGKAEDDESKKVILDISLVETCAPHPAFRDFPVEPIIIKTIERM